MKPREDGWIHAEDVQAALRDDTVLVSIMHGNNELGTVAPIKAIAEAAHAVGAFMHTDAAQTLGKVPFDVAGPRRRRRVVLGPQDLRPKGIGVLYLRKRTPFNPFLRGGGQEFRKRSGTQNVAGSDRIRHRAAADGRHPGRRSGSPRRAAREAHRGRDRARSRTPSPR